MWGHTKPHILLSTSLIESHMLKNLNFAKVPMAMFSSRCYGQYQYEELLLCVNTDAATNHAICASPSFYAAKRSRMH